MGHNAATLPSPATARWSNIRDQPPQHGDDFALKIAAYCADLLQLPTFGIAADFFAEGGDSLSSAQLVAWLAEEAPEMEMPALIAAVFAERTPAMIAARLARRPDPRPQIAVCRDCGSDTEAVGPDAVPLSPAQLPIWMSERFDPGTAKWNVVTAVHLSGEIAAARLIEAVGSCVARHEALRTRIRRVGNGLAQSFDASPVAVAEERGLSDLPASARPAALRAALRDEVRRPFDLEGPLFRARLLRISRTQTVLVLAAHHVIMDGWSVSILLRDIAARYRGDMHSQAAAPGRYAAALRDSHAALAGARGRSVAYWAARFPHGWPPHETICDGTAIPELTRDPSLAMPQRLRLPRKTFSRLAATCAECGATPFVAALAAFGTVLARSARAPEVVIGAAVSRRGPEQLRDMIGVFTNFIPATVPCADGQAFAQVVEATHRLWTESIPFQDAPFAAVQREIGARSRVRDALHLQFAINFHNYPAAQFQLPDVSSRIEHLATGSLQGDLALNVRPARDGSAELELLPCSGRISPGRAREMLGELAVTLEDFARHGQRRGCGNLAAMGPRDRAAVAGG